MVTEIVPGNSIFVWGFGVPIVHHIWVMVTLGFKWSLQSSR